MYYINRSNHFHVYIVVAYTYIQRFLRGYHNFHCIIRSRLVTLSLMCILLLFSFICLFCISGDDVSQTYLSIFSSFAVQLLSSM